MVSAWGNADSLFVDNQGQNRSCEHQWDSLATFKLVNVARTALSLDSGTKEVTSLIFTGSQWKVYKLQSAMLSSSTAPKPQEDNFSVLIRRLFRDKTKTSKHRSRPSGQIRRTYLQVTQAKNSEAFMRIFEVYRKFASAPRNSPKPL